MSDANRHTSLCEIVSNVVVIYTPKQRVLQFDCHWYKNGRKIQGAKGTGRREGEQKWNLEVLHTKTSQF